ANAPALQPTSSYSVASSGVRYVTSKFLGSSGNGSRMLGFVGGNGNVHKANGGTSKSSHAGGLSNGSSSTVGSNTSDGKGSYLIFNVGDTLYITDLTSEEKLQDVGKKLVGAHHYNKDGALNSSRCTSVAWIPERDGAFVA
nr:hypothetical protein [Tanacetum cinerariifolium]